MTRKTAPAMLAAFHQLILETDHWHVGRNDNTCSRCRKPVPDDDVPIMVFANDGDRMLIYCEGCIG